MTRHFILVLLCLASAHTAEANPSNANPTNGLPKSMKPGTTPESLGAAKEAQTLSPKDLQFGEQQVKTMIVDRPQLAKILLKNEPIWPWAVRQFAGEAANERIYWSPGAVGGGFEFDSEQSPPDRGTAGFIRLRKIDEHGKPLAPNRLLAAFVFECFNIRGGPAFDSLYEEALTGALSKDQYIEKGTRIEFAATRKAADFYRNIYLPLAKKRHYELDPFYWEAESPTTYAAWRAQYTDRSEYPWSFWGKYYDESIVPYLEAVKKYNAANKH